MPAGMFLKSQGFASSVSDPHHTHTLAAFCAETGRPYADYGRPVELATFIAYGQWFRRAMSPDLEEVLVTDVSQRADHYLLRLADGGTARSRAVVVAAGVEHFPTVPRELADLPDSRCSHSSAHTDLGRFRDRQVVVLGAGQSALESAALLHERGAQVCLVAREDRIGWNGAPLPPDRPLQLAAAFEKLIHDPQLRRRLGEAGRQTALRNCWKESAAALFRGETAGA